MEQAGIQESDGFIPAKESPLFTALFSCFSRWLFRFRFQQVWVHQQYQPRSGTSTLYYLNHSSWWDGLIPLLLNRYLFRQRGRAVMEEKQMKRYRFFKWLGTFSINPADRNHTLRSLRYAAETLKRKNSALYLYPEGKILPFSDNKPDFQRGIAWLCRQCPDMDIVPVGIYIHTMRSGRPELHIWIGEPAGVVHGSSEQELIETLETRLQAILQNLKQTGGIDDSPYRKWM
ncbi:MAG: lysophospholipid acyltransferase family protein [Balneolaceae bacterium]